MMSVENHADADLAVVADGAELAVGTIAVVGTQTKRDAGEIAGIARSVVTGTDEDVVGEHASFRLPTDGIVGSAGSKIESVQFAIANFG